MFGVTSGCVSIFSARCLGNCSFFFFFKQKTAYEMRISDWSSDVCSSDLGPQGVQGLSGSRPDLTTLAKIIGGGMPVGAFGGRADIMEHIAPIGPVYQAGTLSGNPVAVAAGRVTLRLLSEPGFYERLSARTAKLVDGLIERANAAGVEFSADYAGGMFGQIGRAPV